MHQTVTGWFPNDFFANFYGIVVLIALISDELIPRLAGGKSISFGWGRDRGSFVLIYLASLAGLAGGVYIRIRNIGVVPAWVQGLALVLLAGGTVIREWAIVSLGAYFSRIVKIEKGHRLITSGLYRWIRHPAYTGMLIMYFSIVLGLGTWLGAVFTVLVLLTATLYRIQVEEKVLLETFGDEYRDYMGHTWRLFPKC